MRLELRVLEFVCDKRWDDLATTEEPTIRFCESCQQDVHYCDTIQDARRHARQGHCIAVDAGIHRRDNDLDGTQYAVLGRPSPEYMRQMRERNRPDPVSEARERQRHGGQKPRREGDDG